jgi:hypothetical protein
VFIVEIGAGRRINDRLEFSRNRVDAGDSLASRLVEKLTCLAGVHRGIRTPSKMSQARGSVIGVRQYLFEMRVLAFIAAFDSQVRSVSCAVGLS